MEESWTQSAGVWGGSTGQSHLGQELGRGVRGPAPERDREGGPLPALEVPGMLQSQEMAPHPTPQRKERGTSVHSPMGVSSSSSYNVPKLETTRMSGT